MVDAIRQEDVRSIVVPAIIFSLTSFAEESRPGLRAALQARPPHLAKQVVRVSADNGRPDPMRVCAGQKSPRGGLVFEKAPLQHHDHRRTTFRSEAVVDARQIFNQSNFINIPSVRIDSSVAFSIARNALGAADERMRSASYQLTQRGSTADPIWEVWGYGSSNRYLGVVRLSARTGAVLSTKQALFPRL